jgi:hypothetical protein
VQGERQGDEGEYRRCGDAEGREPGFARRGGVERFVEDLGFSARAREGLGV